MKEMLGISKLNTLGRSEILLILKIVHDLKYLTPWQLWLWDCSILWSCRTFSVHRMRTRFSRIAGVWRAQDDNSKMNLGYAGRISDQQGNARLGKYSACKAIGKTHDFGNLSDIWKQEHLEFR